MAENKRYRRLILSDEDNYRLMQRLNEAVGDHERVVSLHEDMRGQNKTSTISALVETSMERAEAAPVYPTPEEVAEAVAANFTTDAVIDRVARAIQYSDMDFFGDGDADPETWENLLPSYHEEYRKQARYVVSEMLSGLVADAIRKDMS